MSGSAVEKAPISSTSHPTDSPKLKKKESPRLKRKENLLAHLVAAKCRYEMIDNRTMALSPGSGAWTRAKPFEDYQEESRTLAVQSLAVVLSYQGRGLGERSDIVR